MSEGCGCLPSALSGWYGKTSIGGASGQCPHQRDSLGYLKETNPKLISKKDITQSKEKVLESKRSIIRLL